MRGDYEAQKACHKQAAQYIEEKTGGKLIFLSTANVFDNKLIWKFICELYLRYSNIKVYTVYNWEES